MRRPMIGTVSHGTLRTEDLMGAFLYELTWQGVPRTAAMNDADDMLQRWEDGEPDGGHEFAPDVLEALQDELNATAPDYVYFGAHEGDGSDFGYWPSWDALEEDKRCGLALEVASAPEYIAVISDHRNVTLYRVILEELWSTV